MGVLEAASGVTVRSGGSEPAAADPSPAEHDTGGDDGASAAPETPKGREDFVPFAAIEPPKPSRRVAAAEKQIQEHLGRFSSEITGKLSAYEQRFAETQQTIARLQQELAESRRAVPQQQAPQQQQDEDPGRLQLEARKALAENRFDDYERLNQQAIETRLRRELRSEMETRVQELQKKLPTQVDPQIQFLLNRHENVAMSGDRGYQAVMVQDQTLELYGVPKGPARLAKAFELADKLLGGMKQQPTGGYDPAAAYALSGVAPARSAAPAASAQEDGYKLSPTELEVARAARMTPQEYVKYKFPEKWRK